MTVLDRETLKPPFAYVTWGIANPGKFVSTIIICHTKHCPQVNSLVGQESTGASNLQTEV